jgi:hypothetical protein
MIAPVIVLMLAFQPVTSVTVTGKITYDKEYPVSFATVVIKGTRNGTVSNADGIYSITVADPGAAKLVFSSAGFRSKEVKIKSKQVINVKLLVDEKDMDAVVAKKNW